MKKLESHSLFQLSLPMVITGGQLKVFSDFQFRFCIFFSGRTIVFKLRWVLMSIPSSLFVIEIIKDLLGLQDEIYERIFCESSSSFRFSQICYLTNQGGNRNENLREWFPKELNEK